MDQQSSAEAQRAAVLRAREALAKRRQAAASANARQQNPVVIIAAVIAGAILLRYVFTPARAPEQSSPDTLAVEAPLASSSSRPAFNGRSYSAEELVAAYDANTVAADQQFKGQRFRLTATVTAINTDLFDNPYLTIGDDRFADPHAKFDKQHRAALSSIQKGQTVTVECTGDGDVMKTPMLEDCELL